MCRTKSIDPKERLGVYKRVSDVPAHHLLERYEAVYEGRDVWAEYVGETTLYEQYGSDRFNQDTERAVQSWKIHVESRGRHHALARPSDVDTWCNELLKNRVVNTVYNLYWTRIAAFYEWLRWHTDHPHMYDPFLMAANEFLAGPAGEVWRVKVGHWRGVRMTVEGYDDNAPSRRDAIASAFDLDTDPLAQFTERFEAANIDPFEPFEVFLGEVLLADDPRPETYKEYVRFFRQWCEHMDTQERYPACPNEEHVLAFIERELREKENKASTVKGKLRVLSRLYRFWCDDPSFPHPQGYNPFDLARTKASFEPQPPKQPHPISLSTIRERIQSITHIRDRALVVTGFKLGARVGEVRNIRLSDVSLANDELQSHYEELGTHPRLAKHSNAIYIPSRHERPGNKSMRPRILPLDEEMQQLLTTWLLIRPDKGEPWVFLSKQRHGKLGKKGINQVWKAAFHPTFTETDEYRAVTSHYGRHYFCTYWRVQQDENRERIKYMRGDALDEDLDGGEPLDHYLHTYYHDIEERYRERIYRLDL